MKGHMFNSNRKKRNHSKNIVYITLALFCIVATLAGCRGKTGASANVNTPEAVVSQTDDIREDDASSQFGIVTDKPSEGEESKQTGDATEQPANESRASDNESRPQKEDATSLVVDESNPAKDETAKPAQDEKSGTEETQKQDGYGTADDAPDISDTATYIDPDGTYDSKDDVALYLHTYGHLPKNYITKKQAKELGWSGGSLKEYAPGKCIGGDYFGNYEELLPDADYHECDIGTLGKKSRGAKRIIWDDDGNIYYTGDHYKSFEKLY